MMNQKALASWLGLTALMVSFVHAADPQIGKDTRYCNPLPMVSGMGGSASGDVTVILEDGKYYML